MVEKGVCGLCQGNCRVNITVEDGKILSLEPDKESPQGRVCVRGAHAAEMLYGEQRIKKPLIRCGPKGSGQFREASWDEALDHAAEKLKKVVADYGGPAVVSYQGRGLLGTPVARFALSGPDAFVRHLGSPNALNVGSVCNMAAYTITPRTVMGMDAYRLQQDIEHSDYIFVWGKNPATDEGPQLLYRRIKEAQKRGAKLIVIDPRKSDMGQIADKWIPITPGSDGALALAMLKLIIDGERYDRNFVLNYTRGFDEFKTYLDTLDLEQLSAYCGISTEQIRELTDIFCSTEKISLVSYTGLEYQLSGIQNYRAIYILWAITGKLDVEGGICLPYAQPTYQPKSLEEDDLPLGAKEYPVFYKLTGMGQFITFPKAVLEDDPYPVRALILAGGSPATTYPESSVWKKIYEKLDCLLVLDRYYTEDTKWADVVFPACTMFECPRVIPGPNGPTVVDAVIDPVGESKNDVFIMAELAQRFGFGDAYPRNHEELMKKLLAPTPFGKKAPSEKQYKKYESGLLRADGKPGFPTPSGKFEISSVWLEESGFTPYPEYHDIRSIPELAGEEYPFTMTSGSRSNLRMGAVSTNHPFLASIEPNPLMDICAEDAAEVGIADGDVVRVTTPFGSGIYKAKICGMARKAIHVPHGSGSSFMPKAWQEGHANEMCSLKYRDPITGYVTIKSVPCRVDKL